MEQFICGTCEEMCPKSEIDLRIRERLVHFFETKDDRPGLPDPDRMITEFSRSAADRRQPKPSEIRTPKALQKTIVYLLSTVLHDTRRPFHQRYEFIFDRMRAIRQELVIQNLSAAQTLPILEPIVRFLCYSAFRLCESPIGQFDPKICAQHLQECLKKVLRCREAVEQSQKRTVPYRFEMERLYLAFNLDSPEATQWIIERHGTTAPELRPLLGAHLDVRRGNHYGAIQRMCMFAPLEAALVSLQLPTLRRRLLQQFSVAFQSRDQTIPTEWLETILHYDADERQFLPDDCRHYNLPLVRATGDGQGNGAWRVKFERSKFDAQRSAIPPRVCRSIVDCLERSGPIMEQLLYEQ